jgi:hypothetical protein
MPYAVNTTLWDPFDRWIQAREDERIGDRYASAQYANYLPEEIRSYGGTLSRYGAWERHPTYGNVWYPRVVADWRPYYDGHWSFVGSFGWFWVGASSWSWPTHHYGRWGTNAGRWYWIPDRRWGPAWVSWANSPGYVSWCPLGFDNRPIISVSIGSYDSWRAWTVIPSRAFSDRTYVRRVAVNGYNAIPCGQRFVERQQAPYRPSSFRGNQALLRAPSSYARTRTAQPRDGRASLGDRQNGRSVDTSPNNVERSRVISRQPNGVVDDSRDRRTTEAVTTRGNGGQTRVYRAGPNERTDRSVDNADARTAPRARSSAPGRDETPQSVPSDRWGAPGNGRVVTRRAPDPEPRPEASRNVDQPRNSAPERRIENRTFPRPNRDAPPQRAEPERSSRDDRGERSAPRQAPPERGSSNNDRGSSSDRRGASDSGNSNRSEGNSGGQTNGRHAPSGSDSGGSARARSR